VGEVSRYGRVSGVLPRAPADTIFVRAMRFVPAVPEAERLTRLAVLEEHGEVAGVVRVADPLVGRRGFAGVLGRPGGGALASAPLEVARTPALAGEAHEVAGFLEQIGVDRPLGGEKALVAHRLLELPGVAAGEETRAARAALGIIREAVGEEHSLACHAVEC